MNYRLFFFFFLLISCSRSNDIINPQRKNIIEAVYASGKIISTNEYTVYALSNGTIKEKRVKDGDSVVSGQVIYVISNEAASAKLDAAKANLQNIEANLSGQSRVLNDLRLTMQTAKVKFENDSLQYARQKNLIKDNATTQSAVDNAYTTYIISENQKRSAEEKYYSTLNDLNVARHNARSQVATAENDLGNYLIRSQTNGTVFQTLKEAGEAVRLNEPVALLGETNNRIIKLAVDQQDINKLKTGQEVLLKSDVTGNTVFKAQVSKIYPVMNEIDQTFRVDAVFNDSTHQPYIHGSVEANIIIQQKNNVLIIPRRAIVSEDSVQIKAGSKVKTVFVKTGIRTLDDVEIIDGLDESSQVMLPDQK